MQRQGQQQDEQQRREEEREQSRVCCCYLPLLLLLLLLLQQQTLLLLLLLGRTGRCVRYSMDEEQRAVESWKAASSPSLAARSQAVQSRRGDNEVARTRSLAV